MLGRGVVLTRSQEVEVDLQELAVKNIARPLRILFTEPIVLLITIYMSFLYGLLYLSLTAYGIVFNQIYGFSLGVSGLPYFGLIVGVGIVSKINRLKACPDLSSISLWLFRAGIVSLNTGIAQPYLNVRDSLLTFNTRN